MDATGALPFAPPDVAEAVLGAVDEALLNVSKHAGTEHVDLRIDSTADSFAIRIRDGGHSFRTRPEGSDGGPASITARCARVGVAASIDHNPGGGADVRIMWSAAPSDPVENLATAPALLQSLIPAAQWFSMWLIGLFAVNTLIVLGSEPITGSLLALVLLVVAIGAALTFGSRAVPIPWSAAALLTACAAAVAVLPASGSTGCSKIGIGWWGSLGGTMCVVFLVLLSGQVRWLVAGTLSYLAGIAFLSLQIVQVSSDCVAGSMPSIIATDAAWVAAMVLFRRFLVHYGDQAQRSQQLAAATEQRVVAMREHERIRVANLQTVLATIRPLLFGLSNGSVSPQDPTIRRQCAEDEAYLRSLIRIDPDLGALGDELVDAVQAARSRGVALCVRSAEWVPDPAPQTLRAVASVLRRVVDVLGPGAEATVTLFAQPDLVTITILVPTSTPVIDPDTAYANGLSSGLRAAQIVDDDQVLIELEWDRPEGDVAMRVLAAHQ